MVPIWLFDSRNFLSVVAYDPKKDTNPKSKLRPVAEASADPKGWLLIRARVREDLESVGDQLGIYLHITEDTAADYHYRGLVSREDFKDYLCMQVNEIDYGAHFKEVVRSRTHKGTAEKRYTAMLGVWNAMARLQPMAPYAGLRNRFRFESRPSTFRDRNGRLRNRWGMFVSEEATLPRFESEAEPKSYIGLTEMAERLVLTPFSEWDPADVDRLDLEAKDVYLSVVADGFGDDTFTPAELAEYVEDMGLDDAPWWNEDEDVRP